MNQPKNNSPKVAWQLWGPVVLLTVLAIIFWRSFLPDYVHFSNDGPLGQQNTDWLKLPAAFTGMWIDLNDIGINGGTFAPSITALIAWFGGPVGYAKFLAPIALFIVGLGAWTFFRQLKFTPFAAMLGALAAALNSSFFQDACWGTASHQIALGMDFFALALIVADNRQNSVLTRLIQFALAGLCVGINVIEAADVGALYSLFIAAFVFYRAVTDADGSFVVKTARGVGRVAIVAVFAGFIACQTVTALVGTQIQGIAGTAQDEATKAANWDGATQWSLPKIETFGLFVPGLFGYKMDTPDNMMPLLQDAYRGGVNWGGAGRTPAIDRFFDSGAPGQPPSGPGYSMRFTGGENYTGILVLLLAGWTIAQSLRRQNSPFSSAQKKSIWFWTFVLIVCLPIAWGRFAPMFYGALYQLPYFSTIRNPAKFLFFFSWAAVILFAYGVNALSQRQLAPTASTSAGLVAHWQSWWKKAAGFDRKLIFAGAGIFIACVIGWCLYISHKPELIQYLQKVGMPDPEHAGHMPSADEVAAFSISQAGWFLVLFAIAIGLVALFMAGYFAGPRFKIGAWLLGSLLVFDLVRADLPYVIHWDYKNKYEVGSLNPIEDFLRQKSYENRVAVLPFEAQSQLRGYDNAFGGIYGIEWSQQHFPYYNIQSLDVIQMPRVPENVLAYWGTFHPSAEDKISLFARRWELTNTRYLLGAAGFLNVLNTQLDPGKGRFHIAQRFDVIAKPGVTQATSYEQLTVTPSPDGDLALFDFTGVLPRVKLYANWQTNSLADIKNFTTNGLRVDELKTLATIGTNDFLTLKELASPAFDPQQTVLLAAPLPAFAVNGGTNQNPGTVEFKSYSPRDIVLTANATTPSVLLLNDKYDPQWHVTVDGKPAELLRCNYIMRGVYLAPGMHTVKFQFRMPNKPLYITLAAFIVGLILSGLLFLLTRRQPAT